MKQITVNEPGETLKNYLVENKDIVYSAVLESIKESYLNLYLGNIDILEISNNGEKSYILFFWIWTILIIHLTFYQ